MDLDIAKLRSFVKTPHWQNTHYVYQLGRALGGFEEYGDVDTFMHHKVNQSDVPLRQRMIAQVLNLVESDGAGGDGEAGSEGDSLQEMLQKMGGDEKDETDRFSGGGDPQEYNDSPDKMKKVLRHFFEKLAETPGYTRTMGRKNWDTRKLVRGKFNPIIIPEAKNDREKIMEIYFILDSSGSMGAYCRTFTGMLEGSRDLVRTFSGMEAHPNKGENGEKYKSAYKQRFADDLEEWIKKIKPASGSVLVFWGDTIGMNIRGDELKVRKMLRPYRAFWLGTQLSGAYHYGATWEQDCLTDAGFKVIAPVIDSKTMKEAVKRLR